MDRFFQIVIYGFLALVLVGCVSCSMTKKSGSEDLIETAGESGCILKSIKFEDGKIEQIDCHDTIRIVR